MHTSLVLAALLSALDGTAPAPRDLPRAADPCSALDALPAPEACAGAPLCAARDRVATACELRDAIQARYVFIDAKRTLLGGSFDGRAHLDACAAGERAIDREDEPLRFHDRMRRCLAAFEDGHLLVGAPDRLPQVALGVALRRAGGKLVVAWRDPLLAKLAGDDALAALSVGAEVVEIDGRPAAEAAAELGRLVPASSAGARLERAVEALTRRDFAYPERRTAAVTVAAGASRRTVEVPWWVSPGADRHPIAGRWAKRTGIRVGDGLPWFENAARPRPGATAEGAPAWAPLFSGSTAAALREYTDESGRIALRAGVVARGGRDVCYVQVLTFHTTSLSGQGGRRPFSEVVDEEVRACAARKLDMVLDLRRNEGGYLDNSTALAEALAPADGAQPGGALLLRATERNEAVYRERAGAPAAGAGSTVASAPGRVLDAIGSARREGRPFTPAFVGDPVAPRASIGGYSGRIVALTGPGCMSACDRLAAMLHASGRATLVGGPTEGAGGSQQESPGLSAKWTDSRRLITVSIPNAAFGVRRGAAAVVPAVGAGSTPPAVPAVPRPAEIPFEAFFDAYGIENRPVQPDVRYETQLDDVTAAGRGWIRQIDAVLSGEAPRDRV